MPVTPCDGVSMFPGLIAEYRESGRIVGVITGVLQADGAVLQHVTAWPDADAAAIVRMLDAVEATIWKSQAVSRIYLDIEHAHPRARALRALALRQGYEPYGCTEHTMWFQKERPA